MPTVDEVQHLLDFGEKVTFPVAEPIFTANGRFDDRAGQNGTAGEAETQGLGQDKVDAHRPDERRLTRHVWPRN